MVDYSSPRVVIRPALPRDKADVAEFTKAIWEGNDYVGRVFPDWLNDPEGILLVAEYAGRAVGTGKVSRAARGQWWLEGLRVDPKFQGLGIGSRVDEATNAWWDVHGDGVLRLLTHSTRVKVHHLSEQRGFQRVGEVIWFEATPVEASAPPFVAVTPAETDSAWSLCADLAPNAWTNVGWRSTRLDEESFRAAIAGGEVWWWSGRSGVVWAWEDVEERRAVLMSGFEACTGGERVRLLEDFRQLAAARRAEVAVWMNVVDENLRRDLDAAGYEMGEGDPLWLLERFHD